MQPRDLQPERSLSSAEISLNPIGKKFSRVAQPVLCSCDHAKRFSGASNVLSLSCAAGPACRSRCGAAAAATDKQLGISELRPP